MSQQFLFSDVCLRDDEFEDEDEDYPDHDADFDSIIEGYDREIEDVKELDFMAMDLSKILQVSESDIGIEEFDIRIESESDMGIDLDMRIKSDMGIDSDMGIKLDMGIAQNTMGDVALMTQIGSNHSSDIVTTPFLRAYSLAFNTVFKLIICEKCRSGWSLAHIHSHLRNTNMQVFKKQNSRDEEIRWAQVTVAADHNPSVQKMAAKPKFQAAIIDSLKKEGYIMDDAEIRQEAESSEWTNASIPGLDDEHRLIHPIQGIDIFDDCYGCPISNCRYIARNKVMLSKHRSGVHNVAGGRDFQSLVRKSIQAQTLTEMNGFVNLFEVLPQSSVFVLPTSHSVGVSGSNMPNVDVVSLLRQKKADIIHSLNIPVTDDVRTLLPVFVNSGIHKFLHKFDSMALLSLLNVPNNKNPPLAFKRLRQMLVSSFWDDLKLFENINSTVLNLITNCTP